MLQNFHISRPKGRLDRHCAQGCWAGYVEIFQYTQEFGTSPTGVERRYTSNSGQWHKSVCMSYTSTISRQGVRDANKRPASIAVALAVLPRQPLLWAREVFPVVFFQKGAQQ
jgi:hypothetical protein